MSEPPANRPSAGQREDEILERVLQRVDHPGLEDPGLDLEGEQRRLWREYSELAGLLSYGLEPMAPAPGRREELLAAARGERPAPAAPRDSAVATTPSVAGRRRPSRVGAALAAALATAALGAALTAGWLAREHARQRQTIAGLERRLETSAQRELELDGARAELERLRGVLTTAGLRVCPLRPWGEHPTQPVARAAVYLDRGRRQWFLAARGLEPCRQGSYYVLWLLIDGKPVAGGSFRPEQGVPIALAAEAAPGEVSGAFLTLEPDPSVGRPTGPPILYGEEPEEML